MGLADYNGGGLPPLFLPPPPPASHRHSSFNLNSKIMLAATVSLSLVVTLVVLLHLYARCFLTRRARQRAAVRNLALAVGRAQIHSSDQQEPKRGLDPMVIASLPSFTFKQIGGDGDGAQLECAVCLTEPEDEEMARLLPNCKHTFHAECIDKWLSSHSNCPICRTEAQPRLQLQPERREDPVLGGGAVSTPVVGLGESSTEVAGCQSSDKMVVLQIRHG